MHSAQFSFSKARQGPIRCMSHPPPRPQLHLRLLLCSIALTLTLGRESGLGELLKLQGTQRCKKVALRWMSLELGPGEGVWWRAESWRPGLAGLRHARHGGSRPQSPLLLWAPTGLEGDSGDSGSLDLSPEGSTLCLLACPLPSQPLLASRAEESRVQPATLGSLAGWGVERGYSEEWARWRGCFLG